MGKFLDGVRFAAAGGIAASALANIAVNPSDKVNLIVALVGGALTLVLVKAAKILR